MKPEEFIRRFNESGDNEWCSRALSGMYLLHTYTNQLADEMRERLAKYGVHDHEMNFMFNRMVKAFDLWERTVNRMIVDPQERVDCCNDYDTMRGILDKFIFNPDINLTWVHERDSVPYCTAQLNGAVCPHRKTCRRYVYRPKLEEMNGAHCISFVIPAFTDDGCEQKIELNENIN